MTGPSFGPLSLVAVSTNFEAKAFEISGRNVSDLKLTDKLFATEFASEALRIQIFNTTEKVTSRIIFSSCAVGRPFCAAARHANTRMAQNTGTASDRLQFDEELMLLHTTKLRVYSEVTKR